MAAVASTTPAHHASPGQRAVSSSQSSGIARMSSRKLFGRSRKHAASSSELGSSTDSAVPQGSINAAFAQRSNGSADSYVNDKVFGSRDTNMSTSALSTTSTASRTSRFFRKFGRQKAPPVPSLPPSLVLDLDAGTAVSRSAHPMPTASSFSSDETVHKISRQKQPPSAAAAIIAESNAAYAAAETVPKPQGLQRKKMLEAVANARLDVSQTRDLVRMCGLQIRERGLDTSGLFRPFRIAESPDHVYHMIQLFLLSIDVSTYIAVFPILPEDALDRFGSNSAGASNQPKSQQAKVQAAREELDKELRYAAPHDVVSVMKWGLRHMRLRATDFASKDAHGWYDVFAAAERESGYHARAIADLLHPNLPQATAELLSEVLDLMASVAAHSSSNHMPASALCELLGFWLFGKIGVAHPPPTVDELVEAVKKTTSMAEHLLLAHIRSQAAVTFSMPLRLTELVERYPYIKAGQETPCLPPAFASRPVTTLRIDLRSDNLVVSQGKPRGPSATLAAALGASASDNLQGGQGEMWAALMSQLDHTVEESIKGYELLSDEHVRILRQVDQELTRASNEQQAENGQSNSHSLLVAAASKAAAAPSLAELKAGRRRSQSLSDLRGVSFATPRPLAPLDENSTGSNTPRATASPAPKNATPRRKPVPLATSHVQDASEEVEVVNDTPDDTQQFPAPPERRYDDLFSGGLEPSASWRSFSEEGFGGMSTASSELSLSEFPIGQVQTMPSRRSNRSLYRVRSSASNGSRRKAPRNTFVDGAETDAKQVTHTVTSASLVKDLDSTFAVLWQDQLLDSSPCCRFPQMVFVQLRAKGDAEWLLVSEMVVPPRPATPVGGKGGRWDEGSDREERRSIFAPSMKSVKMRLRRVSTVIGNGVGGWRKEQMPPMPGMGGAEGEKV